MPAQVVMKSPLTGYAFSTSEASPKHREIAANKLSGGLERFSCAVPAPRRLLNDYSDRNPNFPFLGQMRSSPMNAHAPSTSPASVHWHENLALILEDTIRRRAYKLYERRGRADGHDIEDWLLAEEEIRQISDGLLALFLSGVTIAADESRPSEEAQ